MWILGGTHPNIKDTASICDRFGVGLCISAAAANMKTNTDHIQSQLLGPLQEAPTRFKRSTKLHTEATHRLGVICGDTQHQPEQSRN